MHVRDRYLTSPWAFYQIAATHVPWCMPRSLTRSGGENDPGIPGACTTSNFTYLVGGSCRWPIRPCRLTGDAVLNHINWYVDRQPIHSNMPNNPFALPTKSGADQCTISLLFLMYIYLKKMALIVTGNQSGQKPRPTAYVLMYRVPRVMFVT